MTNVDRLIPCLAPRDCTVVQLGDICSTTMTPPYCFAALPDQRLFAGGKSSAYMVSEQFRWTVLPATKVVAPTFTPLTSTRLRPPQKVTAAALMSDGEEVTHCVYAAAAGGLFYNPQESDDAAKGKDEAVEIVDSSHQVRGLFRQHDHLYVVCRGPGGAALARIRSATGCRSRRLRTSRVDVVRCLERKAELRRTSATSAKQSKPQRDSVAEPEKIRKIRSLEARARVARNRARRPTSQRGSLVGAYYDEARGRLLLGTSDMRVGCFLCDADRWTVDAEFDDKMGAFKSRGIASVMKKRRVMAAAAAQLMYFDEATNHCILIGSDMVAKISMDPQAKDKTFGSIHDAVSILRGSGQQSGFEHLLYIMLVEHPVHFLIGWI